MTLKQINEGETPKKEDVDEPEGVQVDFVKLILDGKVYFDSTIKKDEAAFWENYIKCHPDTLEKLVIGFLGMTGNENLIEDTLKMYKEIWYGI